MKKIIFGLLMAAMLSSYSFAQEQRPYAAKGVWELGGNIEFYGTRYFSGDPEYDDSSSLYFNLAPQFDYFVIDGLHIGFAPGLSINSDIDDIDDIATSVYLVPTASLGYSFRLAEKLFLDVKGSYGFGARIYDNYFEEDDLDTDLYMNFGLTIGFKVPVSNAVFNFGVRQNFQYETWNEKYYDDVYQAGLVFGVSAYL
ncbi:MAG TPA: hypothetical protein PK573_07695 [Spirochaetota bacterium]|nr:hypothetical protein [Spirochaetota bacterium]